MGLKVYLASRFSREVEMRRYADELAALGIEVTSRWFRGGHAWVGTDDDALPIVVGARFAQDDIEDIEGAHVVVCFTEAPRSGPSRGGRHVEYGYALGRNKPIMTVGHRENVFYCLNATLFFPDWERAKAALVLLRDEARALAVSS